MLVVDQVQWLTHQQLVWVCVKQKKKPGNTHARTRESAADTGPTRAGNVRIIQSDVCESVCRSTVYTITDAVP